MVEPVKLVLSRIEKCGSALPLTEKAQWHCKEMATYLYHAVHLSHKSFLSKGEIHELKNTTEYVKLHNARTLLSPKEYKDICIAAVLDGKRLRLYLDNKALGRFDAFRKISLQVAGMFDDIANGGRVTSYHVLSQDQRVMRHIVDSKEFGETFFRGHWRLVPALYLAQLDACIECVPMSVMKRFQYRFSSACLVQMLSKEKMTHEVDKKLFDFVQNMESLSVSLRSNADAFKEKNLQNTAKHLAAVLKEVAEIATHVLHVEECFATTVLAPIGIERGVFTEKLQETKSRPQVQ